MKKYFILLVFVFAVVAVRAQIVGDISVTRRVLTQHAGQLCMELDIRVARNAVTRSQSWMIIPELSTADRKSVKLFPHVLVNGQYQQHMMERRRKLRGLYWAERQPYAVVMVSRKTDQVVRYQMQVPYEAWMSDATLVLRQVQVSQGENRRVFTVDVNGAVDAELN